MVEQTEGQGVTTPGVYREAPRARTIRTASGLDIAALEWGDEGGAPVLGLHGWLDNAATFTGLAPQLDGLHLVAIDHAGHGLSAWRGAGSAYHFVDYIADAIEVADALGWTRFSILGHSLGGAVGALLAGTIPDRIERVVVIDALGPSVTPAEDAPAQLERAVKSLARRGGRGPRVFGGLDDAVARMLEVRTPLTPESARTIAARGTTGADDGIVFRHDPLLHTTSRMRLSEEHVGAFMQRIACPVLLVRPEEGWPVTPEHAARRTGYIEDLTIVRVPGGHHVHLDTPDVVRAPVQAFLSGARVEGDASVL